MLCTKLPLLSTRLQAEQVEPWDALPAGLKAEVRAPRRGRCEGKSRGVWCRPSQGAEVACHPLLPPPLSLRRSRRQQALPCRPVSHQCPGPLHPSCPTLPAVSVWVCRSAARTASFARRPSGWWCPSRCVAGRSCLRWKRRCGCPLHNTAQHSTARAAVAPGGPGGQSLQPWPFVGLFGSSCVNLNSLPTLYALPDPPRCLLPRAGAQGCAAGAQARAQQPGVQLGGVWAAARR